MSKSRTFLLLSLAALLLVAYGCAAVATPLPAFLYSGVTGPIQSGNSGDVTKEGEACASSFLGIVASGDASIDAAKQAGGIKEVVSVDHKSTSVLGIYASFCTIVKGR